MTEWLKRRSDQRGRCRRCGKVRVLVVVELLSTDEYGGYCAACHRPRDLFAEGATA